MKRRKIGIAALASVTALALFGSIAGTIAWFHETTDVAPEVVHGSVQGAYYAGGDGTASDPFRIHDPIHLYNLAWLHYFGTYNKFTNNALTSQTYFEVTADLDMTGWTLPPIGTEQYPFLGSFNGNGHVITGLTSSNDLNPNTIQHPQKFTGFSNENPQPEIVGFFGVVGKLPDDTYTYDSSVNQMVNVTLNSTTVKSRTAKTLIGLAAGYTNGSMSGIKIDGDASIDVNGSTASTAVDASGITGNLSDYGLVGYSTKAAGNGLYSQDVSTWYDAFNPDYGGTERPALGGHTSVKEIYDRLDSIDKSETHYARIQSQTWYGGDSYSDVTTSNIPGSNVLHNYKNNNDYYGSFCFADPIIDNNQTSYINITGERPVRREVFDASTQETLYYFNYNSGYSRYLPPRNNESTNVFASGGAVWEDTPSKSNGWYITGNFTPGTTGTTSLGAMYTISGNQRYYLYLCKPSSSVLARQKILSSVPSAPEYIWSAQYKGKQTKNGIDYYAYYISAQYNGTPYYLGSGSPNVSSNSREFMIRKIDYSRSETILTDEKDNYDTYFPLIVDTNGLSAAANNTGYVVSSSDYEPISNLQNSGAIQLSRYQQSGNFDYSALKASNQIRTVNSGGDVLANSVTTYNDYSERYSDFDPSTNYPTYFYGLRFRDAAIDIDNQAIIEKGKVNGSTFTNRSVPRNCIDFTLDRKGDTAFFAGTYQEGATTAFFSLHKITRSGSEITAIDEIKKIYRHKTDTTADYIYETSASSPEIPSQYELVFNTDWITNPSVPTEHRIYYFEIPLNSGEYALGTVPGKGGAYLMYFDIGASLVGAEDKVNGYTITTRESTMKYPIGIDFDVPGASAEGGTSFCVSIASSKKGVISFNVVESNTGVDISITDASSISVYSYQGTGFGTAFTTSGDSPGDPQVTTITTKTFYITILTQGGATHTVKIVKDASYYLDGTSYPSLSALIIATPVFTETQYSQMDGLGIAGTFTRSGAGPSFNITPTYSDSDRKNVLISLDVTGVNVAVSGISTYHFYKTSIIPANEMINGQTYSF